MAEDETNAARSLLGLTKVNQGNGAVWPGHGLHDVATILQSQASSMIMCSCY